jgi:hypothetical protein
MLNRDELVGQLRAVRELLEDERAWIQGTAAVDAYGNEVEGSDPNAVRRCLSGACDAVDGYGKLSFLARVLGEHPDFASHDFASIHAFNDDKDTTHADVLRLIDVAIEQAELGAE